MKKRILLTMTVFFSLTILSFAETAIVRTKTNHIRTSNRLYAPIVTTVTLEDTLEIISEKGEWLNVRFNGKEGWIHKSAVEKNKKKELRPVLLGAEMAPEETDEVTLAGKGFNPQVEKDMQKKYSELNFSKVDQIESQVIDGKELEQFIKSGGLNLPQ